MANIGNLKDENGVIFYPSNRGKILYQGEDKVNDITLNDDASNYKYLKIFYTDDYGVYNSVEVYEPEDKKVGMMSFNITGYCYQKYCIYYISGKSMTFQNFYEQYNNTKMTANDSQIAGDMKYYFRDSDGSNPMKVRMVIGYI